MAEAKIFLVGKDEDDLLPMIETAYQTEDILQIALAKFLDLLPGDQINPEAPRRWLLVLREIAVPGDTNETGRWSLDHLFLDQDGIPTFVECKRAIDTRIRREVVAQMLDYAANGIEYWSVDRLRQSAVESTRAQEKDLDDEVAALIRAGEEIDVEAYWEKVASNLEDGRVRLIFVADQIPGELQRLVEFLNEKLIDVEVLAVEVKQFLGEGQRALVPRVIGLTEAGRRIKGTSSPRTFTNRVEFLGKLPAEAVPPFEEILDTAAARGHTICWGKKGFSVRARLSQADRLISFMYG